MSSQSGFCEPGTLWEGPVRRLTLLVSQTDNARIPCQKKRSSD
jgi:hypothetical protein